MFGVTTEHGLGGPQHRHPFIHCHLLARRLRGRTRRVGLEQQVSAFGRIAQFRADDQLRAAYGAWRSSLRCSYHEHSELFATFTIAPGRLLAGFIPKWNIFAGPFPQIFSFIIFLIAFLSLKPIARCSFDLPEAESELVGGFHTEYRSMGFASFFMAEIRQQS